MAIGGKATAEGTGRYARKQQQVDSAHYRENAGIRISDLGIGTYLGSHDEETDQRYTEAVAEALQKGINVVDTAINYRFQRSERSVGEAVRRSIENGAVRRDEIVIATKGGFLSFDGAPPRDPMAYLQETFFDSGIIRPQDIVAGCHSMHPDYVRHQLHSSLKNLGLDTIDIYYLHNVETQLEEIDNPEFEKRLGSAFSALEEEAANGAIVRYGLATWDGFRVPPSVRNHLSLERILEIAKSAGGERHRFSVVQLPFNFVYREAAVAPTQMWKGRLVPFLHAAAEANILVMASVPLFQGKLLGQLPAPLAAEFKGVRTDAQRAISFVAATPGLHTALAGMSSITHVEENTNYLQAPRLDSSAWVRIIQNLGRSFA
ncbi:MAG TPA: aldo/keto reductase [Bdellovibrionota bacterium]|nr:aldo/keto reductase [Bdellovibrionota bacterium]